MALSASSWELTESAAISRPVTASFLSSSLPTLFPDRSTSTIVLEAISPLRMLFGASSEPVTASVAISDVPTALLAMSAPTTPSCWSSLVVTRFGGDLGGTDAVGAKVDRGEAAVEECVVADIRGAHPVAVRDVARRTPGR